MTTTTQLKRTSVVKDKYKQPTQQGVTAIEIVIIPRRRALGGD